MRLSIEVVDKRTGEIVKSLDLTGRGQREIERAISGLSQQLNHEHFYVRERQSWRCGAGGCR